MNADADDYQARHGQQLAGDGKAWGPWNLLESELHVLADPYRTVPEVARLLGPGGRFAFCQLSPIADLCWPNTADRVGDQLVRDYFGMHPDRRRR